MKASDVRAKDIVNAYLSSAEEVRVITTDECPSDITLSVDDVIEDWCRLKKAIRVPPTARHDHLPCTCPKHGPRKTGHRCPKHEGFR